MTTLPRHAIPGDDQAEAKRALRRQIRTARASCDPRVRRRQDALRAEAILAWLRPLTPRAVAAYVAVDPEPDLARVIDVLHAAGVRVLLPIIGPHPDGSPRRSPDWGWYAGPGSLRDGLWGIREPNTDGLGLAALSEVDVALLPGLAADQTGHRLGMGGGWYDRALAAARPDAPLCVAINAEEFVETLPHESHDVLVTHVATPDAVTAVPSGPEAEFGSSH